MNNRRMLMQTFGSNLFENAAHYYKLDETSGDALDFIGTADGILNGGVTQGVNGKIGTAYSFDGVDDYVNFGTAFWNNINPENFTYGIWFQTNDVNTTQIIVSDYSGSSFLTRKLFAVVNGNTQGVTVGFGDNGGNQAIESINTISSNTWYLLIIKYDSSNVIEFKLNNVSQGTYTFVNAPTQANGVQIGDRKPFPSFPLNGKLDEQFIIDGQTTAGQDSDIYNNGNGVTI